MLATYPQKHGAPNYDSWLATGYSMCWTTNWGTARALPAWPIRKLRQGAGQADRRPQVGARLQEGVPSKGGQSSQGCGQLLHNFGGAWTRGGPAAVWDQKEFDKKSIRAHERSGQPSVWSSALFLLPRGLPLFWLFWGEGRPALSPEQSKRSWPTAASSSTPPQARGGRWRRTKGI